jgi:dephospho-CoA kinase
MPDRAAPARLAARAWVVGLTGGIAAGKSTVARMLAECGARVMDADQAARAVVRPGEPALAEIVRQFGDQVLLESGELDRARLAELVFGNETERQALNAITHWRIARRLREEIAAAEGGAREPLVIVVEAAVLREAGWDRLVDEIVIVSAKQFQRVARLMQRYGLDHARALDRVRAQKYSAGRRDPREHYIDASVSLERTAAQVKALWPALIESARRKFEGSLLSC